MNIFKSHFWHDKGQRNGVFLLGVLILVFQIIVVFVDFSIAEKKDLETPEVDAFYTQIERIKALRLESKKFKPYPFNPNYITDYKGAQLGMSLVAIDKLLAFRKTGKFINSKKAFQEVTGISDTLLEKISPFFKFPDWVKNQQRKKKVNAADKKFTKYVISKRTTTDLNKATIEDLKTIEGIGVVLSKRIIKYRSKLQGFSMKRQLLEVWGLKPEIAHDIWTTFNIYKLPNIQKLNVNTVTFKELLNTPYIDYDLCKKIFEYRDAVAELQNISELTNIQGFPLDLYDRIALYLMVQ
jgi:DNA uptake protein ComE-like DNA-binding protein